MAAVGIATRVLVRISMRAVVRFASPRLVRIRAIASRAARARAYRSPDRDLRAVRGAYLVRTTMPGAIALSRQSASTASGRFAGSSLAGGRYARANIAQHRRYLAPRTLLPVRLPRAVHSASRLPARIMRAARAATPHLPLAFSRIALFLLASTIASK